MYTDSYIVKSLELHLFFGRIMKEHSLFLEAGFTPADVSFSKKADIYKQEFENLLCNAVSLSDGVISRRVLDSGEIFTDFTALAEKQTECFTGITINKDITNKERFLRSGNGFGICPNRFCQVRNLNRTALRLLDELIAFKEEILRNVLNCKMFTMNYPLLIEHITREAKLYREYVQMLERRGDLNGKSMRETECFWNQIMMEHAMFIRGLLDPSETELFNTADEFAEEYLQLLKTCCNTFDCTLASDSLSETVRFRDFKTAGTKGIVQCEIRSVILPLLADHVLREANHYIRILKG